MTDMVTTGDVARSLGVTVNTVKAWIRRGSLIGIRLLSGHYRIPRAELRRLHAGVDASPLSVRRRQWQVVEEWSRSQPPEEPSFASALAWVDEMLRIAESQGPVPEPTVDETVERVASLHRALALVRR